MKNDPYDCEPVYDACWALALPERRISKYGMGLERKEERMQEGKKTKMK